MYHTLNNGHRTKPPYKFNNYIAGAYVSYIAFVYVCVSVFAHILLFDIAINSASEQKPTI